MDYASPPGTTRCSGASSIDFHASPIVLPLNDGLKHGIKAVQLRIVSTLRDIQSPRRSVFSVVSLSASGGSAFDLLPLDRKRHYQSTVQGRHDRNGTTYGQMPSPETTAE
jgi:hypothetical protein